jgi:hypothetical protein
LVGHAPRWSGKMKTRKWDLGVSVQMAQLRDAKRRILVLACGSGLALAGFRTPASAKPVDRTDIIVVVKDAETGQPISQARLTLQFREPGRKFKPKLPKQLSYSAKTNKQGRYRFTDIPKGTVRLIVTDEQHQSFGKDFDVSQDDQVLEVRLKKPQPLL